MTDLVANLIWEDPSLMRALLEEADHGRLDGGVVWLDPYLMVHDPMDPDDGPLYVMYALADGTGATVLAPGAGHFGELERRCYRCLGSDWTMDDHSEAARRMVP